MMQTGLSDIRQLVKNGAFTISHHAYNQMLSRNITYDDVELILTSSTNEIIERQSPSTTLGKAHADERVLVYDPCAVKDVIVILVVLLIPAPDVRIVTVEYIDDNVWERREGQCPSLIRK